MVHRFENTQGTSNKFWEVEIGPSLNDGRCALFICWGRIGTTGTRKTRWYKSVGECLLERNKIVRAKLSKGYVLVLPKYSNAPEFDIPVDDEQEYKLKPYYSFDIK